MDFLKTPPERLYKRFQMKPTGVDIQSLDVLSPYLSISPFVDYIQTMDEIRIKNIWNTIVIQWANVKYKIKDNTSYKKSQYPMQIYSQIHTTISHEDLDTYLNEFINNDLMKAVFVLQCILEYVFPR